jgi:hypothetical protein
MHIKVFIVLDYVYVRNIIFHINVHNLYTKLHETDVNLLHTLPYITPLQVVILYFAYISLYSGGFELKYLSGLLLFLLTFFVVFLSPSIQMSGRRQ